MLDLIIKGGRVVTPQGADVMDVGVQGDKIVAVGWPGTLAAEAARAIDATGKIVVPGGIEPHAHIGIPVPEHWAGTPDVFTQPPEAASRAAAFGGVTTVIDFAGDLILTPPARPDRRSIISGATSRQTRMQETRFRSRMARTSSIGMKTQSFCSGFPPRAPVAPAVPMAKLYLPL